MVDVVVSPDSLSLVGGPASINVDVDFGPAGIRGSQIFVGRGQPNNPSTVIGQTPNVLDLYINIAPATVDEEYLNVYQYQSIDGSNIWVRLFDLLPEISSFKRSANFTSGESTVYIPVSQITSIADGLLPSNFNVQYNIENLNPIASSITLSAFEEEEGVTNLPILIKAAEFSGGAWSDLSGPKSVSLLITMV
jgi:hypothetical protein